MVSNVAQKKQGSVVAIVTSAILSPDIHTKPEHYYFAKKIDKLFYLGLKEMSRS